MPQIKHNIISSEAYKFERGWEDWLLNAILSATFGMPVVFTVIGGLLLSVFAPDFGVEKISGIVCFTVCVVAAKVVLVTLFNNWRLSIVFLVLYGMQIAVVLLSCKDYIRILLAFRRSVFG